MRTYLRLRRLGISPTIILAALTGCADDAPPIGQVRGLVTRDGTPVPNLTINFMPSNGRPSWGLSDAEGRYTLHWDADQDGAEVGMHKVNVVFMPGSPGEEAALAKGTARLPKDQLAIVKKYGGLETSPLKIEVKSGRQAIDLKLD